MTELRVLDCVHAGRDTGKRLGCNCKAGVLLKVYECALLGETTNAQCGRCKEYLRVGTGDDEVRA